MEGDNFSPPGWRLQLAQFLGVAKIALIVLIVASINPFPFLGFEQSPSWFQWLCENKLYGCLMIFFISESLLFVVALICVALLLVYALSSGNAIETQLISTGAFEIELDNLPVWSKIESGRIPQPPELFQIIENHFKLNTGEGGGGMGVDQQSYRDEL